MNVHDLDKLAKLEIELDGIIKRKQMFLKANNKNFDNPILINYHVKGLEVFFIEKEKVENSIKELMFKL